MAGLVILGGILFIPVGSRGSCTDGTVASQCQQVPISLFQMITGF